MADSAPQQTLKSAVQTRYFELVSEGTSPNSAAANAIREIGSLASRSQEDLARTTDVDKTAPRQLRFDLEGKTPSMSRSASAPSVSAVAQPEPEGSFVSKLRDRKKSEPHPNRDVWKTFGIHLPAGRSLKRLYGGAKLDPVPGALKEAARRHLGPPSELDTYVAVNNLQCGTAGLQFRKSMNIFDLCKGEQEFVRWGDAVEGHRVDAAWLQVGDRYLPTVVNKIQLLKPWRGPEAKRTEGLERQRTLPPLKRVPSDPFSRGAQLHVGGVPYRS
jgi:hypothetical protein